MGERIFDKEVALRDHATVIKKFHPSKRTRTTTSTTKRSVTTAGEPFDIAKLHRRASFGKEVLTDDYDGVNELYYRSLSIGTPAQTGLTVDFDTRSSDLWLPLSTCTGCYGPLFTVTASSTYKSSTTKFSITYEDGSSATGTVATDTVTVAGLTVAAQGFGAPTSGLLGLGFTVNAESGKTPFFINLVNSGALTSNVFAEYMARDGTTVSEPCVGCIDSTKYTGAPIYFPLGPSVTDGTQYHWNTPSKGLFYNGGTSTGAWSAVIDTGTTLFYIPTADAKAFYAKIPGAASAASTIGTGFYTYPCSTVLAPITVEFGNTTVFAVNPLEFNLGAFSRLDLHFAWAGSSSWYSIFDYANLRVGFAKSV
ncbi:hypothetical protein FRB93_012736 [Tulasnella sp. JGI-2019a]|nr:hypothetical protein FRB93_012736 [Tulasnella sp. JGI-2019a]